MCRPASLRMPLLHAVLQCPVKEMLPQELLHVLFGALEVLFGQDIHRRNEAESVLTMQEIFKGTVLENTIQELFEGSTEDYVRCVMWASRKTHAATAIVPGVTSAATKAPGTRNSWTFPWCVGRPRSGVRDNRIVVACVLCWQVAEGCASVQGVSAVHGIAEHKALWSHTRSVQHQRHRGAPGAPHRGERGLNPSPAYISSNMSDQRSWMVRTSMSAASARPWSLRRKVSHEHIGVC